MNIVLLGPPGSGKGTQSKRIAERYNLAHISTGDLLRDAVANDIDVGIDLKAYLDVGKLVPDEVISKLLQIRLSAEDVRNGYILDGYPRTLAQAYLLESFLRPDVVLLLDADYKYILNRITTRSVCSGCKATLSDSQLINNLCPICGSTTFKRSDDNEQTFSKRFQVYEELTTPLIDFYKTKDILKSVDGNGGVEEIFDKIKVILDGVTK